MKMIELSIYPSYSCTVFFVLLLLANLIFIFDFQRSFTEEFLLSRYLSL